MQEMKLTPITANDADALEQVKRIYLASFPECERRPWSGFIDKLKSDPRFAVNAIFDGNNVAGLITFWDFGDFVYGEHFAINQSHRNCGIGGKSFSALIQKVGKPFIIEVEPSGTTPYAGRRIGFYQRLGFTAHPDFEYVQPPYAPYLQPVTLMLMTTAPIDLAKAVEIMKKEVYGVSQ